MPCETDTEHRIQDTGYRTQDAGREIDDMEAEFIRESLSLLYEYKMLGPDNEYGWDSWTARAERLMIRQRLYEFLKKKGALKDYESLTSVPDDLRHTNRAGGPG